MKQKILDIVKQKGHGFKVPEGYFNTVEGAVLSELTTDTFPKNHGFTTPKGYFEAVEDAVRTKLSIKQLPKEEGFTTPKGYFDSLEDQVFAKLGREPQQTSLADVPEGYFETLEDRVFARLEQEKALKEPKVITLGTRLRKVWAPVAVAASLAVLAVLYYNKPPDIGSDLVVDELIEENLINLDSYEIAEVFNDVDLASNEEIDEDHELLDYLNSTDVESMLLEN